MTARYLTASRLRELESGLIHRDLMVIESIARLRFMSGAQLTRLHFDGSDTASSRSARRALLRLVRLGALARLQRSVGGVRAGSAGFVYCLGLGGQALAAARGWQPAKRRRRSVVPGTLFLEHTLLIAELHIRLVEADRGGRFELLELNAEPACWRSYGGVGSQRQSLKPDSYVRLGVGPYEDSYFIEVDRGTEGTTALLRQLQTYVAYARSGQEQAERGVLPRTLWLSPSSERTGVIADCIWRLPSGARELFSVTEFDAMLDVLVGHKSPANRLKMNRNIGSSGV